MKQWLIETIAADKKDISDREKRIGQLSKAFMLDIEESILDRIDRITEGDTFIDQSTNNRLELDRIVQDAESSMRMEFDILLSGTLATIITRARNANNIYGNRKRFNFDPVQTVQRRIAQLENDLRNAARDAVDRIGGYIEEVKQSRTRKSVLRRNLSRGAGIVESFTRITGENTLFEVDRMIRDEQMNRSDLELMLYVGPDDSVTRDWCQDHVNKTASREYWNTAENDVGPQPPLIFGGGYNCRHRLLGVDPEWIEGVEIIG